MKTSRTFAVCLSSLIVFPLHSALAQDWPQWRGPNRDAKAASFNAPKVWPKELTQKWKVTVGEGVSTPSLVGDKLYVFARQEGNEITRCLDAATGKELWSDKYEAQGATGPASGFSGPRCSPTVTDGKVLTIGVRGTLSCFDAATGKVLWRKDDFQGAVPRFFTSSSPMVAGGLCIAQLGGEDKGAIVAYDIANGNEKWKWTEDGPAYASLALMTVGGTKLVVAQTSTKMVALTMADGKTVWEAPFAVTGRGYNASSPVVDDQTIIYCGSGRGATAVKIEKNTGGFTGKELWKNPDNSVMFNTPALKDGFLYGLSANNDLFCVNARDGKTTWTAPFTPPAPAATGTEGQSTNAPATAGGQGGGRGGRGGGGRGGYGSIVDAGSVLLALTPGSDLVAFQPGGKAYTELARIKVAATPTYAYPVVSGNRVFVKDQDSVILWSVQ